MRISKGSYDEARSEALRLRLIEEVVSPQSKAKRQEAVTGCYALRWDDSGQYRTALGEFVGFFASEGNRTAVPGEFFTQVIPHENLNVIKVVGAVVRHTIGYESQFWSSPGCRPLAKSIAGLHRHQQPYTSLGSH